MALSRVLFPISLGNNRFSTFNVLATLASIKDRYDEVVFIIADRIQIYNRVAGLAKFTEICDEINKFNLSEDLLIQRRAWLEKLKKNTPIVWTVLGFNNISDSRFANIFRNVLILYHTVKIFRDDIANEAVLYLTRTGNNVSPSQTDINLSIAYMLEEIAASLRLRVCEKIPDEYYLGSHLRTVVKLYSSAYGVDVFSLANVEPFPVQWRFYEPKTSLDRIAIDGWRDAAL